MSQENAVIAIDLGGTKCSGAVVLPSGEIKYKVKDELSGKSGDQVAEMVCNQTLDLWDQARLEQLTIIGIGVSVPGISNMETDRVWAPNIPGWDDYPLRDKILNILLEPIPVIVDNDRACSILGESWKGSAQGCKDVVFMAVGTGIGAGILINGQVLRGRHDIAGSIGWMAMSSHRPEYTIHGCFEYNASGPGILRVAGDFVGRIPSDYITHQTIKGLTTKDIFEFYEKDDPIALKTIEQFVTFWGMAVANLVSLLNPEKIIFAGGVFGPGLRFLDMIYDEAQKWAQPIAIKQVSLEGALLGNDAILLGAVKPFLD